MSEQERAEQAIEALVRRAIEVARPIDKVSKIRPRTFEDGHYHGLVEAMAIMREHFPIDTAMRREILAVFPSIGAPPEDGKGAPEE